MATTKKSKKKTTPAKKSSSKSSVKSSSRPKEKLRSNITRMQLTTQLALFLANKPGSLSRVCHVLAEKSINIFAISTSDSIDHSVVRLIVDDFKKARNIFEEIGTLVVESEVLMIEGNNESGNLAKIADLLSAEKINIEYAYCATSPKADQGLLILRPTEPAKAMKILNTGKA